MKILQLCFRVPYPPHDGGAIAMYNITKGLSEEGHQVTVLAFNTPKHFQKDDVLNPYAHLKTVYVDTSISSVKALFNLFSSIPYNVERFINKDFKNALIQLLTREKFDVVHDEGLYLTWYIDVIKNHFNGPVILRTHNLEYQIWDRLAKSEKNILKRWYLQDLSRKLKRFEIDHWKRFDAIAAISPEDAKVIQTLVPEQKVQLVPPGIEITPLKEETGKPTLFILAALEWQPNLEGIWWFLKEVWPILQKDQPLLELHIAGKRPSKDLENLRMPNVFVHGFVPDALEFMRKNGLMLVPLWSGSGTRIKILDGMAAGKCILSTSIGAEGMEYIRNQNILIADSRDEWVNAIRAYFNSPETYLSIGKNAYHWVNEKYNNKRSIERLLNLYKELL